MASKNRAKLLVTSVLVVLVLFLPFVFLSVARGETGSTIYVSGSITTDTTWHTGDEIIITDHTTVSNGATLTIEPGVKVKFVEYRGYQEQDRRLRLMITDARIIAVGSPGQPIYFTSAASDPQNGDYDSVIVTDSAMASTFSYCIFEFGITGLQVGTTTVNIDHSVARWNNESAIALGPGSTNAISYCQVYQNGGNGFNNHQVTATSIDHCEIWDQRNFGIHALGFGGTTPKSQVHVQESILHHNLGAGLVTSLDAEVTAYGLELYDHPGCAINNDGGDLEVSNLDLHDNGTDYCTGTLPDVSNIIFPPSSIDIGFVPDMSNDLGYIPGDQANDLFPYVFDETDETRHVVSRIGAGLGPTFALAWDGAYLWTTPGMGRVYKLDPSDGSILENWLPSDVGYDTPDAISGGMTFDDEGYLWVVDTVLYKVFKIDPVSHDVVFSFPAPSVSSSGLEWDGAYLAILDASYPFSILRVDKDGTIVETLPITFGIFGGLTWDGTHYWVPDTYRIYEYDVAGRLVGWIYAPGFRVNDMAWDDTYLWATATTMTQWNDAKIFKIQILDDHDGLLQFIPAIQRN